MPSALSACLVRSGVGRLSKAAKAFHQCSFFVVFVFLFFFPLSSSHPPTQRFSRSSAIEPHASVALDVVWINCKGLFAVLNCSFKALHGDARSSPDVSTQGVKQWLKERKCVCACVCVRACVRVSTPSAFLSFLLFLLSFVSFLSLASFSSFSPFFPSLPSLLPFSRFFHHHPHHPHPYRFP